MLLDDMIIISSQIAIVSQEKNEETQARYKNNSTPAYNNQNGIKSIPFVRNTFHDRFKKTG